MILTVDIHAYWTGGPLEGKCDNILWLTRLNFGYVEDKTNTKTTQVWQKIKNERKLLIKKGPSQLENFKKSVILPVLRYSCILDWRAFGGEVRQHTRADSPEFWIC